MGRGNPGGHSLLLHVCEILNNEGGREQGGREGVERQKERRGSGKEDGEPGKPHGSSRTDVTAYEATVPTGRAVYPPGLATLVRSPKPVVCNVSPERS